MLRLSTGTIWRNHGRAALLGRSEFVSYFHGLEKGFAVLLDDARALERRWRADELRSSLGIVPPQSFRYLSAREVGLLDGSGI